MLCKSPTNAIPELYAADKLSTLHTTIMMCIDKFEFLDNITNVTSREMINTS